MNGVFNDRRQKQERVKNGVKNIWVSDANRVDQLSEIYMSIEEASKHSNILLYLKYNQQRC